VLELVLRGTSDYYLDITISVLVRLDLTTDTCKVCEGRLNSDTGHCPVLSTYFGGGWNDFRAKLLPPAKEAPRASSLRRYCERGIESFVVCVCGHFIFLPAVHTSPHEHSDNQIACN
jgi:hypothetical protein